MAYATEIEYAEQLGIDLADVPTNIGIRLEEASSFLDAVTNGNRDDTDTAHTDALRKATIAQAAAWVRGEAQTGGIKKETIGTASTEYVTSSDPVITRGMLAPEAAWHLSPVGLLYRGVRLA